MDRVRVHRWLGVVWIILAIPGLLWWQHSILFVLLMSLYANVESSLSAFESTTGPRRLLHLGLAAFWIGMVVPTVLWWQHSIPLVILMSLYANIENSFSAAESAGDCKEEGNGTTAQIHK